MLITEQDDELLTKIFIEAEFSQLLIKCQTWVDYVLTFTKENVIRFIEARISGFIKGSTLPF